MFMQDFIKTWDNELDAEYCQTVIDYYHTQQGTRVFNRQSVEGAPKAMKDGDMLYDEGETGTFALSMNKILQPYYDLIKNQEILEHTLKHESWKNYIY